MPLSQRFTVLAAKRYSLGPGVHWRISFVVVGAFRHGWRYGDFRQSPTANGDPVGSSC